MRLSPRSSSASADDDTRARLRKAVAQRKAERAMQTVESGDLFRSNDHRDPSPRIVRVVSGSIMREGRVECETMEHWDEKQLGRRRWIGLERLAHGRNKQNGYTKVSH